MSEVFVAKIGNLPGMTGCRNGANLWIFGSQLTTNQQVETYGLKTHAFASLTRRQSVS
ncbi:hypothetical protein D3C76_748340 [compost metagenome]